MPLLLKLERGMMKESKEELGKTEGDLAHASNKANRQKHTIKRRILMN